MTRTVVCLASLLVLLGAGCTTLAPGTDPVGAAPDAGVDVGGLDTGPEDTGVIDGGLDAPVPDGGPGCFDPSGFGGVGCYACEPLTRDQLLTACTSARFEPFDNGARLPDLPDGGLPPPPSTPDAGVDAGPPPMDAGARDAAVEDVGPVDAAVDAGPSIPLCSSLPNPVYATGSSAVSLFLGQVAQRLQNETRPVTVIYQSRGSCVGVSAMLSPAMNPMTGNAIYWDPRLSVDPSSSGAQLPCRLDGPTRADVGFSDVFADTCQSLPTDLRTLGLNDFTGPIQVMNFVVPVSSTQRAISAEAAYLVYGFGGDPYPVPPWIDASRILQRDAASGTQALLAASIRLPRDRWVGVPNSGSSGMRAALTMAGMSAPIAEQTIGILASDVLDANRTNLRGLAYRHYGQPVAFYPDSLGDTTSRDKRNVRDGHYPLFGPLHILARADGSGLALSDDVQHLVNVINGIDLITGLDIINVYARTSLIPQCAMRVTRTSDSGDLMPYVPTRSCGCYYEQLATGVARPEGCTSCTVGGSECGAGTECVTFTGASGTTSSYCE